MKKTITLFSLIICLLLGFNNFAKAQSIEDSLLIYYSWDSTIFDQSGNGYDPIGFRATFVEDRLGNLKRALYFNGIDDHIVLPSHDALQPPLPLSFSLWFKLDDLTPEHGALFVNDFNEDAHSGVWMNISSAQRLAVSFGDGWDFTQSSRKTFLTDMHLIADKWYFATGVIHNVYDIRIFINGEEQTGYVEGIAANLLYAGYSGDIGRKDATYQYDPYYFKGFMDEFMYWNRGLSNDEVEKLYEGETLSVNKTLSDDKFIVFPNPTKDVIHISTNLKDNYVVKIYDQVGKLVFIDKNSETIDLSNFPNGLYFINIENSEGKRFSQKIIKQ